jgi:hypothetical protein
LPRASDVRGGVDRRYERAHDDRISGLAAKGLFDRITIHRVVPDFVVQAGSRGAWDRWAGYAIPTR